MSEAPLRVMVVFGTRPDTIKMAPVVEALKATPGIVSIICATAQHREMLDDLLTLFAIVPDIDLNVMRPGQSLTAITTRVLEGMEPLFAQWRPDVVLVHGDTGTSTAAALAAFYARVPVAHVEAGLRTDDPWEPYPEEMNRRITTRIATQHFAPTPRARRHLLAENVPDRQILVTGNTVIDAFLRTAERNATYQPACWNALDRERPWIFVTAHRRENHEAMESICEAIEAIADLPEQPEIIWPVHPSPQVAPVVHRRLDHVAHVHLLPPLGYAETVRSVAAARFVLTDSGGLQEEAPCLGRPVLVMRRQTERPEGIEAGTLELVGSDPRRIVERATALLRDAALYRSMSQASNPYGDGQAAERIVADLLATYRDGRRPTAFSPSVKLSCSG